MSEHQTFSPGATPGTVRAADGRTLAIPEGWACLPPGDAGLTRRVKALGPSWQVVEVKGRKKFSRGLWAPAANIDSARAAIEAERLTPAYQKKLAAGRQRREREQAEYVEDFTQEVATFLRFAPAWGAEQAVMARAVSEHATPVGSGTVARTERISIERRAEAAVIAWMRHQTTAYDSMCIERRKGARREVRRELAEISRAVLARHRVPERHLPAGCPLCRALVPLLTPTASPPV